MIDCNIGSGPCRSCGGKMCIRNVPLLSSLNQEETAKISEGVVFTNYTKGEYIFRAGDKADKLYIVVSGKMKIFNFLTDGREQILYIYASGDFVGAFNLLKEDEFKYNAEALEDTTIATLSKNKFDKIILKNPEITLKILEKAYERIRDVEGLVVRLSAANADAKVAGLLIELIKDFGSKVSTNTILELSINREEMGNYAGISRETMTRKLNHFRELGYIDFIGNKKIVIKNENKLRELL